MTLKRLQKHIVRLTGLLVGISILFFVGLYGYRVMFGYNYDGALFEKDLAAGVQADENITNIALFGLDTREGDTQSHSDCVMIASVDNTRGKIKLISLMRDSLVEIDGHGEDKLNAAYFMGGPALAIRTINENFGTDITSYVAVEFEQLVQIIDTIGGVDLEVQDYELKELNRVIQDYGKEQGKEFELVEKAGRQTLDGVQSLCYGRIRKGDTGDDWGRVERQSIVLSAIFNKLDKLNVNRTLMLMQKLLPYVTCSLSPTELAPLIVGAFKNGRPKLEHARIPLDGEWQYYGESSEYILYDVYVAADHIQKYIYDDVFPGGREEDTQTSEQNETGSATSAGQKTESTPTDGKDGISDEQSGVNSSGEGASSGDGNADNSGVDGDNSENSESGENGEGGEEDEGSYDENPDYEYVAPEDLVEEGGSYDPETGDYYDSDGDRYYLDDDGDRVYY